MPEPAKSGQRINPFIRDVTTNVFDFSPTEEIRRLTPTQKVNQKVVLSYYGYKIDMPFKLLNSINSITMVDQTAVVVGASHETVDSHKCEITHPLGITYFRIDVPRRLTASQLNLDAFQITELNVQAKREFENYLLDRKQYDLEFSSMDLGHRQARLARKYERIGKGIDTALGAVTFGATMFKGGAILHNLLKNPPPPDFLPTLPAGEDWDWVGGSIRGSALNSFKRTVGKYWRRFQAMPFSNKDMSMTMALGAYKGASGLASGIAGLASISERSALQEEGFAIDIQQKALQSYQIDLGFEREKQDQLMNMRRIFANETYNEVSSRDRQRILDEMETPAITDEIYLEVWTTSGKQERFVEDYHKKFGVDCRVILDPLQLDSKNKKKVLNIRDDMRLGIYCIEDVVIENLYDVVELEFLKARLTGGIRFVNWEEHPQAKEYTITDKRILALEDTIAQRDRTISEKEREITVEQEKYHTLSDSFREKEAEISEQKKLVGLYRDEVTHLKQDLIKKDSEHSQEKEDHTGTKAELESKTQELTSTKAELEEKKQSLQEKEGQISSLNSELSTCKQEKAKAERERDSNRNVINKKNEENGRLKRENQQLTKDKQSLTSEKERLEQEKNSLTQQVSEKDSLINQQKRTLESQTEQIHQASENYRAKETQLAESQKLVGLYRDETIHLKKDLTEQTSLVAQAKEQVSSLTQEKSNLEQQKSVLEEQAKEQQLKIKSIEAELQECKSQSEHKDTQISDIRDKHSSVEESLRTQQQLNETLTRNNAQLQNQVKQLTEERDNLTLQGDKKLQENQQLQRENESYKSQVAQLTERATNAEQERDECKQKLETDDRVPNEELTKLQSQIEERDKTIAGLRELEKGWKEESIERLYALQHSVKMLSHTKKPTRDVIFVMVKINQLEITRYKWDKEKWIYVRDSASFTVWKWWSYRSYDLQYFWKFDDDEFAHHFLQTSFSNKGNDVTDIQKTFNDKNENRIYVGKYIVIELEPEELNTVRIIPKSMAYPSIDKKKLNDALESYPDIKDIPLIEPMWWDWGTNTWSTKDRAAAIKRGERIVLGKQTPIKTYQEYLDFFGFYLGGRNIYPKK